MISRSEFDAYNGAAAALADEAERVVAQDVLAWCKANAGAGTAECRAYAAERMRGMLPVYDEAAASIAADWCDERALASGKSLKPAVTATTYDDELVEKTARYQAKKLADGDLEGFARSCGELARNDAMRSLNETMRANCRRDEGEGVMFARVPTGWETCTFCLRLASYGAIYASRKAAGEFNHYHRRCDCKVVPCFDGDPMGELVEGCKPKELHDLWRRFEEIDGSGELNQFEKAAAKRNLLGQPGPEIVYKKPMEAFESERGGKLDLAAHKALCYSGHEVVVLEEDAPEGFSNIDLLLDGRLCELKSPTSDASGTNGLRFIERNIRKAIKQLCNTEGGPTKPVVIALNCETVSVTRDDAIKRVKLEMARHNVDVVYLITRGGLVDKIEK